MNEPDWSRLPFFTDGSTWKMYCESPSAPDITPGSIRVWVERDACFHFSERIQRDVETSFNVLGNGVTRWVEERADERVTLDGKVVEVEFNGAPGAKYTLSCMGGDVYCLHLSVDYYRERDRVERAESRFREKRLVRSTKEPGRTVSTRNVCGATKPTGKLLRKWLPENEPQN